MIFMVVAAVETNRAPFDLTEAEAELSGGYNTEYPGVVFSLIFIAEYSLLLALIAASILYFFGGSLFS